MFSPRFTITSRLLEGLIEVERFLQVLDLVRLEGDWEERIKKECLVRRAGAMLSFGGNQLNSDDFSKIVKDDPGRDDKPAEVALRVGVVARERDMQEVMNWLNANRLVAQSAYLSSKFGQEGLTEKEMLSLNSLLGERVVSPALLGGYRENETEELKTIEALPAIEIPYLVEDLFIWYKGAKKTEIHPLLKAGIVLHEIIRMRPFAENNLLTGLFLFALMIASDGYGMKEMWAFEEELLKDKQKLMMIVSTRTDDDDMTGWLEFLVKNMAESAKKAKIKIMNLVGDRPAFRSETGRTVPLSERQIQIMEEMVIQGEMTIKGMRTVLPMVSDDTILRDLKDLMTKKLLKKKGRTKGAVYTVNRAKGFR